MTLDEKLTIYETVIFALRKNMDMTKMLTQFPMNQQLEAIRFMEFIDDDQDSLPGNDRGLQ